MGLRPVSLVAVTSLLARRPDMRRMTPADVADIRTVPARGLSEIPACTHEGTSAAHWNSGAPRARSFSRVLFRTVHLADGLRRKALRLQVRVGYPVAESQHAGSGQCCRQGAAPPDGVGWRCEQRAA